MASGTTGLGMAQQEERRQPIRSVRLSQRGGMLHVEERQGWHRHWREPYRFMLAIPWPGFLLSIAASYLLLNLAFTLLYALDLDGIGGAPDGQRLTVLDAFFFSVQTLGSIGYGVLHPSSLWVNLVVTVEAFFGLLFIAVTTGLAFARFSRSRARLRFSRVATIEPWQGHPTLTFRVANVRQNSLVDGRIRASLAMNELSGGRRMRRLVNRGGLPGTRRDPAGTGALPLQLRGGRSAAGGAVPRHGADRRSGQRLPRFQLLRRDRSAGSSPAPASSRPWGRRKSISGPTGTTPVGLIMVWLR